MDHWILKQLRNRVLSDLRDFIPEGYFDTEVEKFALNDGIKGAKLLSFDMRWGYLAGKLANEMYFHSTLPMSARQTAACEVLMHLGLLESVKASRSICENISQAAQEKSVSDGNAACVAEQMGSEHIPQLQLNLLEGLQQYLLHLTTDESRPFMSLVANRPIAPIHLF